MEFPERISEFITKKIAETLTDLSDEKLEQISYGIAVLIANLYKYAVIFIAAYFLKVFGYMLIALFSFGFLRTFAAGLHAKKEWTCLVSSTAFVFGTIYISKYWQPNYYVMTGIYLISLFLVYTYSPADSEERPIFSKSYRLKMKILSSFAVLILYAIASYYYNTVISGIITTTTIIEVLLILPVTYKIAGAEYATGLRITKEEV